MADRWTTGDEFVVFKTRLSPLFFFFWPITLLALTAAAAVLLYLASSEPIGKITAGFIAASGILPMLGSEN